MSICAKFFHLSSSLFWGREGLLQFFKRRGSQLQRQLKGWRSCSRTIGGEFFGKLIQKLSSPCAASQEYWRAYLPAVRLQLYAVEILASTNGGGLFWKDDQYKVMVATMTHDHDYTPHAILTLLVVPAGKWVNLLAKKLRVSNVGCRISQRWSWTILLYIEMRK